MMALSGVRSSWLMFARNCDLCWLATSSSRLFSSTCWNSRAFSIATADWLGERLKQVDDPARRTRPAPCGGSRACRTMRCLAHQRHADRDAWTRSARGSPRARGTACTAAPRRTARPTRRAHHRSAHASGRNSTICSAEHLVGSSLDELAARPRPARRSCRSRPGPAGSRGRRWSRALPGGPATRDRLADLAQCRAARRPTLSCAVRVLQLLEQPGVFDGDDRLVRERLHQRDLAIRERLHLVRNRLSTPSGPSRPRSGTATFVRTRIAAGTRARLETRSRHGSATSCDVDRSAVDEGAARTRSREVAGRRSHQTDPCSTRPSCAEARHSSPAVTVVHRGNGPGAAPRPGRPAEAGRRLDDGLECRPEIGRRGGDDAQHLGRAPSAAPAPRVSSAVALLKLLEQPRVLDGDDRLFLIERLGSARSCGSPTPRTAARSRWRWRPDPRTLPAARSAAR